MNKFLYPLKALPLISPANMVVQNTNKFLDIFEVFCGLQPYSVTKYGSLKLSIWKSIFPIINTLLFSTIHVYNYKIFQNETKFSMPSNVLRFLQFAHITFLLLSLIISGVLSFINGKYLYSLKTELAEIRHELLNLNCALKFKESGDLFGSQFLLKIWLLNIIIFSSLSFGFNVSTILKVLKIIFIILIYKIPYTVCACVEIKIVSWYLTLQDKYEMINCILEGVMKNNNKFNFNKKIDQLLIYYKIITIILNKINCIYNLQVLLIVIMNYLDILVNGFQILYNIIFQDKMTYLGLMYIYSAQVFVTSIFSLGTLSKHAHNINRKVSNIIIILFLKLVILILLFVCNICTVIVIFECFPNIYVKILAIIFIR